MKRAKLSFLFAFLTLLLTTHAIKAQENNSIKERDDAYRRVLQMSSQEIRSYYKRHQKRVPNTRIIHNFIKQQKSGDSVRNFVQLPQNILPMPNDMWYPNEAEEVQAIVVTWPYFSFLKKNSFVEAMPFFEGVGIDENNHIDSIVSVMDTITARSEYPYVFSNLINAIQQEAQVWINLWNANDTNVIKKYMSDHGMPLTNYRFFISYGNSFWYRDCGPIAFYFGSDHKLGMLDVEYYPGRQLDDLLPEHLSNKTGIPLWKSTIEWEGGNCLVDGAGTLFTSDAIYAPNADTKGQYIWIDRSSTNNIKQIVKKPLSRSQVKDTLMSVMNLKNVYILPAFKYDGGTGHIDLYADMIDENSFVFSKFPEMLSSWTDYATATSNIDAICSYKTIHQKEYKKDFIPFPKDHYGRDFSSQTEYNTNYARTYSNHTFVNKLIIQPIFSDPRNPSKWDSEAIAEVQKKYMGYKIYPINVSSFDGSGGAIHCITKQIPAENPIRILHSSIIGNINKDNSTYPIEAIITNKSGIASATCYWKTKKAIKWEQLPLTAGANNSYFANLQLSKDITKDTIVYYISATSNNGKTISKPITAPNGYYNFFTSNNISSELTVGNFYPNPSSDVANLDIQSPTKLLLDISIVDVTGKIVHKTKLNMDIGSIIFTIKTELLSSGVYNVVFYDGKKKLFYRKLMVK